MALDIPKPFKWTKAFEVFYSKLDEQHKGLFDGIFNCDKSRADPNAYKTLHDRITGHFQYEEQVMDDSNFGDYADHKASHDAFVKRLEGMSPPLSDDDIDYAMKWLVNHISVTDFKYKDKLNIPR